MKRILLIAFIFFASAAKAQDFKLQYEFEGMRLEVPVNSASFEAAIEDGSQKCIKFYFSQFRISSLSDIQKNHLANVCTNPR